MQADDELRKKLDEVLGKHWASLPDDHVITQEDVDKIVDEQPEYLKRRWNFKMLEGGGT